MRFNLRGSFARGESGRRIFKLLPQPIDGASRRRLPAFRFLPDLHKAGRKMRTDGAHVLTLARRRDAALDFPQILDALFGQHLHHRSQIIPARVQIVLRAPVVALQRAHVSLAVTRAAASVTASAIEPANWSISVRKARNSPG